MALTQLNSDDVSVFKLHYVPPCLLRLCDQMLSSTLCSDLTNTISVNQVFLEAGSLTEDCADLSFNTVVETRSVLSFYNINCRPV